MAAGDRQMVGMTAWQAWRGPTGLQGIIQSLLASTSNPISLEKWVTVKI